MKLNDNIPQKKEAAFFDMDKTIISVFSEQAFALYLLKKGKLPLYKVLLIIISYIVYAFIIIRDYEKLKKMAIYIIMHKQSVEGARQLYTQFFNDALKQKIYPDILEEIEQHRKKGRKLVMISSSIDLVVAKFAEYLKFDRYFAAELEIKDKFYTGKVLGRVFNGKRKVEAVLEYTAQENINLEQSFAYGDYVDDQHMLDLVGNPVAVNPDKKLRKIALSRNWIIKEPVPC